jgi:GT2 family glycosyltransferase
MSLAVAAPARSGAPETERLRREGKLLRRGDRPFFVRGVTYGTFRPSEDGHEYPGRVAVEKDFGLMASHGVNAVRTYTVPPLWFLDAADQQNLQVLVGLPVERYVGYLADPEGAPDLARLVQRAVRPIAGHPATICYSLANEIPAPTVRWHGQRHMQRFLERLCAAVRQADPSGLVTYVNYPTTEDLDLPFLDLVSFNVYLENPESFDAYLARLQNLAGNRPLLLTEVGLDSLRNGEDAQACSIEQQLETAFAGGCAGAFVYAWTDEWHRGGEDVFDWEFGLTRRDRRPKPALDAVRRAFGQVPFSQDRHWPRISVVVCSYNGSRTIRECLEGVGRLQYPNHEVLVVDNGSTDDTGDIARELGFRVIRTPENGLSNARNTGMMAATGEIVAYLDDDAWPDPLWLHYLAEVFERTGCAAAGGPAVPPPGDGFVAACVADAPGNPAHVLLTDREAEHLPGCNLAIRRSCLQAVGGFDAGFRTAGDDVDVCWRLRERGWSLGFHASALVWHHCRGTLRTYWRQQRGYGRSEGLLEAKWPEKYNGIGHLAWGGRVYTRPRLGRSRIYHGVWGTAPFQSIYGSVRPSLTDFALMPEWLLAILALTVLALLGLSWPPLAWAAPLAAALAAASIACALRSAAGAPGVRAEPSRRLRACRTALTSLLYLMQPIARLRGRIESGLTPWRRRRLFDRIKGWRRRPHALWAEHGQEPQQRLFALEAGLRDAGAGVLRGGPFDRFDLEARAGVLGGARLLMAVEEHGGGCQLVRLRSWARPSALALGLALGAGALATGAALGQAWTAAVALCAAGCALLWRIASECGSASATVTRVVDAYAETEALQPIRGPDQDDP